VLELDGSKGTAHFIKKWEGDRQQSYLKLVNVKKRTGATEYTASDSGKFVTLVAIECRGVEPVSWMCKNDFTITTEGGAVFEEVTFDEGYW